MNPYTDARATLYLAYAGAGITTYAYIPPTITPPLATITPGRAWITPNRVGSLDAKIELTVTAWASVIDPATALDSLETLVSDLIAATPSGFLISSIDAPAIDSTASQGDALACEIHLTAQVKEG